MIARVISLDHARRLLDRASRTRVLATIHEQAGGVKHLPELLRAIAREFEKEARGGVCAAPAARVGISVRASV